MSVEPIPDPGLREKVYIQGFRFNNGPQSLSLPAEVGETRTRAKAGNLMVHRNAFPGGPLRMKKHSIPLVFDVMEGDDIDTANDIVAFGGPLDLCLWRPDSECFVGGSGYLTRRNAPDAVPDAFLPINPTYARAKYILRGVRAGVADPVTFGSVTVSNEQYRTAWSSVGSGGLIFLRYFPLYRVYVAEGQPTFDKGSGKQGQLLTFEEA